MLSIPTAPQHKDSIMSKKSSSNQKTPFTQTAVSRIMSATAKNNGGKVASDSFAAKAQSILAKPQPKK
jgi:hypothetical protein